ncbi:hypothetical protein BH11MYX3_BH11MYX3_02550 [soil metagenome]
MNQIALALLGAALVTGCMTAEPMEDESVETSEVIIRDIPPPMTTYPVTYFVLDDSPTGCAAEATDANIREGLRLANESWAASNVHFKLESVRRIHTTHLRYLGSPILWPGADMADDLSPMMGMGKGIYLWLAALDPPRTSEGWLQWVDDFGMQGVTIYVPCAEASTRYYGHVVSGGAHIPAAFVGSSLVGYHLALSLGL